MAEHVDPEPAPPVWRRVTADEARAEVEAVAVQLGGTAWSSPDGRVHRCYFERNWIEVRTDRGLPRSSIGMPRQLVIDVYRVLRATRGQVVDRSRP